MPVKYPDKLRNWFYYLENEDYPSLGPNLYHLGFSGIWHPTSTKYLRYKRVLYYLVLAFFLTSHIKFLLNVNKDGFLLITQYAPIHINIIKSLLFRKQHKHWEKVIYFTAEVEKEELAKQDRDIDEVVNNYIAKCRRVVYFYWGLCVAICSTIIFGPFLMIQEDADGHCIYEHIVNGFTPFENKSPGCYYTLVIETLASNIMAFYLVGWNTLVWSIMIFFAGQLQVAQLNAKRLIESGNFEKSHKNIAEFHRFYMSLVEHQQLFNSLISLSMFLYEVMTAINLSANIINIVQFSGDDTTTLHALLNSAACVLGCFIELLMLYWYGSKVGDESSLVSYATFSSSWVGADLQLQKEVALLGITTSAEIVFDAGPFHKMTLNAFVTILRASYTFFTLISTTK